MLQGVTTVEVRVTPGWLRLREPADAAARSLDLARKAVQAQGGEGSTVVHDLGCGSGSMGRWLAPHLAGPQQWVLHDRDADLLRVAADDPPRSADGSRVTVETRCDDLTRLAPDDLAGATMVTASALLDMLSAPELARFARSCVAAAVPALVTLSVTGRVRLTPGDPLDPTLGAAFNRHQRRTLAGRTLLGPVAARAAVEAFGELGARVEVRPSPWRLAPHDGPLILEWLAGWVGAAVEQCPELRAAGADYLRRRRDEVKRGVLHVTVEHLDLLALPPRSRR